MDNQEKKKIPKWKEERIDARIFHAESRMFAGELPDRMVKNGKELSFLTVKGNDLPMIERIQTGFLYKGINGYIWKTTNKHKAKGLLDSKRAVYQFKKIDMLQITIKYRRSHIDLYFTSAEKRDNYYNELINGREILDRRN